MYDLAIKHDLHIVKLNQLATWVGV